MTMAEAILTGNLAEVKRLQIENPACIDEPCNGISLPNLAASTGNLDILKYIVEYSRASFNETDENNRTLLFYAVPTDNAEMVKYIVERLGMSGLYGDKDLITPYDLAVESGADRVRAYFKELYGDIKDMYRNPVRTGMHPDPSIICVGDDFYMVNSSFIYFPCIPISHSRDLIHWKVIGHAVTNPEWAYLNELEGGRGYWAPDISYFDGRFYITATYRLNDTGTVYRRQMVVSSDKPEGPYCEPAFIEEDGIDPSIFTDDDGKRYMLLNRGARIFEISADGKKQLSEATLLYYGHQKRAPEGSHLLKKDGWYYLFQAEGGTGEGHRISVSRSDSLFGVYKPCPFNPILRQNNPKAAIQRCGHGKPVCTPKGEWYIPYLCGRQIDGKYSMLGRETALDKITWTKDGWPMVNNLEGPSTLALKPDLPEYLFPEEKGSFEADTDGGLSKLWSWVRVPEENACRIEKGILHLRAGRQSLSTMYSRNILVRPQEHFRFQAVCGILLEDGQLLSHDKGQAGMTCYYDENTYLTFHVENHEGRLLLKVTEHVDTADTQDFCLELPAPLPGLLHLKVETDYLKRSFSYALDEGDYRHACTLENVFYLCDEGIKKGKRFTGAMVGMYAYLPEEQPVYAAFTEFTYQGR